MTEMLIEPRTPDRAHRVAGLEHRAELGTHSATDQAEMPAVFPRHHLEDCIRLPVAARAEHDAFVGPFHRSES